MWVVSKTPVGGYQVKVFFPQVIELQAEYSLTPRHVLNYCSPPPSVAYGRGGLTTNMTLSGQIQKVLSYHIVTIINEVISRVFRIKMDGLLEGWNTGKLLSTWW